MLNELGQFALTSGLYYTNPRLSAESCDLFLGRFYFGRDLDGVVLMTGGVSES